MEKFTFEVTLSVEVMAYDKTDAEESLEEHFGDGPDGGLEIIKSKWELTSVD